MDKVYKAKVSKVYPNMNQNNQSFRVDADFIEDPGLDFIHSSVEANIIINKKDNALVIPMQALRSGSEVQLKSGKKMVKVKTGLQNLEDVEIESGITEQDEVLMAKD